MCRVTPFLPLAPLGLWQRLALCHANAAAAPVVPAASPLLRWWVQPALPTVLKIKLYYESMMR